MYHTLSRRIIYSTWNSKLSLYLTCNYIQWWWTESVFKLTFTSIHQLTMCGKASSAMHTDDTTRWTLLFQHFGLNSSYDFLKIYPLIDQLCNISGKLPGLNPVETYRDFKWNKLPKVGLVVLLQFFWRVLVRYQKSHRRQCPCRYVRCYKQCLHKPSESCLQHV